MSHKSKEWPRKKMAYIGLLVGVLIIVFGLFIWGLLTGRIKPFAAGNQIQNTANYTYINPQGQNIAGTSNTVIIQVTSKPAAPTNLAAIAPSSSQINLTWTDNADNEDAFKIERSLSAITGFVQIGTAPLNATTYSDSGLSGGTTYYYRVRAYNTNGDSDYSNVANARTMDVVPAAPSNLTCAISAEKQIDLSWQDNSNNETGFKIERSLSAATGFAEIATVGANIKVYNNTGLTAGTTYYYRVRANNSAGDSAYSNVASEKAILVPNAPTNLGATADSNLTVIHLSWQDNATNEVNFQLMRMIDGTGTWEEISRPPANATAYDDNTIQVNILYWYQIRASNKAGFSAWSNQASAKVIRDTQPPTAPTNLTGNGVSYSQINLAWGASTDNVGVTQYCIYRNGVKIRCQSASSTSYSDINLLGSTTYTYFVTALDAAGNESAHSNQISVTTPAPPDNPPQVTITNPANGATVSGTVSVTANATDDKGISKVDFYLDSVWQISDTISPYSWNWNTLLVTDGSHVLMARATDTSGQFTDAKITVTVQNQQPAPNIYSVKVKTGPGYATISWLTDIQADSQVCYGTTPSLGLCTPLNPTGVTKHSIRINGLSRKTTYCYQIKSGPSSYNGTFKTK